MKSIILLGYMGAGKTTIGHALAKDLGVQFYDLDWYIEMRFHKTVAQIFQERGEEGFREIERNMLHEVAEFENVVISCGGGTPCFFDNMDYMNAQGITVFLAASVDVIHTRLTIARVQRPLVKGKTADELRHYITDMLEHRRPHYARAQHLFCADRLENNAQVAESVKRFKEQIL